MNRELLQQALDALEYHTMQTKPINHTDKAIEAIKQELAKPEQEPFKPDWANYRQGLIDGAAQAKLAKPEQEPVATRNRNGMIEVEWGKSVPIGTKLYAAPPRKPWVSLSDAEEIELDEKYGDDFNAYIDARDAKLKEKNSAV
jgi:hypothetical protein